MAIKSLFFNAVESGGVYDRVYNAEDFSSYLGALISDGVFANPSSNLMVRTGSGMATGKYVVKAGKAWIKGHLMIVDADYEISPTGNFTDLTRMDRVVAYVDFDARTMGIDYKVGVPRSNPEQGRPGIVRNDSRYELGLAVITVRPQQLLSGDIEDTRGKQYECGWVSGLIEQVDTSSLFTQYQQAYNAAIANMQAFEETMQAWMNNMQAQFDAWFETLTEQLLIQTYIQKFEKTVIAPWSDSNPEVALDMQGYTYDSSDVLLVFINGLKAVRDVDYSVFVSNPTKIILTAETATTEDQTINIFVFKSKIGFNTLIDANSDEIITSNNDNIVV